MRSTAPKDATEVEAQETREWLESLDYVLQSGPRQPPALRPERVRAPERRRAALLCHTSYINTIPVGSGRIMRALDRGKTFVVTRNGQPVEELVPLRHRAFVPSESAHAAFVGAPPVARTLFRRDVDAFIDQAVTLRG